MVATVMTETRLMNLKKKDLIRWLRQNKVDLPSKNQLKEFYLGLALQKHAELGGDAHAWEHVTMPVEKKKRGRPPKSAAAAAARARSKSPHPSRSITQLPGRIPLRPVLHKLTSIGRKKVLRFVFLTAIVFGMLGYAYHLRQTQRKRKWCWQR